MTRKGSGVRVPYGPLVVESATFAQFSDSFVCPVAQAPSSSLSNPTPRARWSPGHLAARARLHVVCDQPGLAHHVEDRLRKLDSPHHDRRRARPRRGARMAPCRETVDRASRHVWLSLLRHGHRADTVCFAATWARAPISTSSASRPAPHRQPPQRRAPPRARLVKRPRRLRSRACTDRPNSPLCSTGA
jgi:hypothetical protein